MHPALLLIVSPSLPVNWDLVDDVLIVARFEDPVANATVELLLEDLLELFVGEVDVILPVEVVVGEHEVLPEVHSLLEGGEHAEVVDLVLGLADVLDVDDELDAGPGVFGVLHGPSIPLC